MCVQFRPKVPSDIYYITIRNGSGCSSNVTDIYMYCYSLLNYKYWCIFQVGQGIGNVTLQVPNCIDDGRIMHEFMHTLGKSWILFEPVKKTIYNRYIYIYHLDKTKIYVFFLFKIGFFHEQSRPDRDSYVSVNFQNIPAGKINLFHIRNMFQKNINHLLQFSSAV